MKVEKIDDATVEEIQELLKDAGIEGRVLTIDLQSHTVEEIDE